MRIDTDLVTRLVAAQFPAWADLPVTPVEPGGWDNRTFRLGTELSVRLPSAEHYVAAVGKEQRWLPHLAPRLPLPVPAPVGLGTPAEGYPWPWSVNRWLPGSPASETRVDDLVGFATALAGFLTTLRGIDADGGPLAGDHSFHRGGSLAVYDAETRAALRTLADRVDVAACTEVWETARASSWPGPPVWFHGDVSAANLLVEDGRLSAVIDFGTCGVGDPACDTVIAWTLLSRPSRQAYVAGLGLDADTWARGRGWALWKALITLAGDDVTNAGAAEATLREVLADPVVLRQPKGSGSPIIDTA